MGRDCMFNLKQCLKNKYSFIIAALFLIPRPNATAMNEKEVAITEKNITAKTSINFDVFAKEILAGKLKKPIEYNRLKLLVTACIKNFKIKLQKEKAFANCIGSFDNYIQKIIPTTNDTHKHVIIGDIHASANLFGILLWMIDGKYIDSSLKIQDPNIYVHFLGDVADKGDFGVECWFTLLTFKLRNWDQVHIIRGNHESNEEASKTQAFSDELRRQFGQKDGWALLNLFVRFWNRLPHAIIANDMIMFHGGFPCTKDSENDNKNNNKSDSASYSENKKPISYKVPDSFIEAVNNTSTIARIPKNQAFQLRWNDFSGQNNFGQESPRDPDTGKIVNIGTKLCKKFLEQTKKELIIRGHQHLFPFMWSVEHYQEYEKISYTNQTYSEQVSRIQNLTKKICNNFPQKMGVINFTLDELKKNELFFGVLTASIAFDFTGHYFLPIVTQTKGKSEKVELFYKAISE